MTPEWDTKDQLREYAAAGRLPVPLEAALELVDRGCTRASGTQVIAPMLLTPTPSTDPASPNYVPGAVFDVDRVERTCKALAGLRHTKGRRWANQPLVPEPWQLFWYIAPVWGWIGADTFRIIRTAWLEVGRKNGKSTMASGLMIVLLVADGELGAEVYSAAASTDQARQVFEPAKAMMVRAPLLAGKFKALADVIRVPQTGSIFRVLSRVADTAHGLNVSGAVVDEVHVHKSRDLIDALDTGEGARDQPLILYITTSDDGTVGTIYDEKHGEVESLASGIAVPDYGLYGAVWAVPEGEDPFLLENVKLANPNVGVSISEEYLEKKAARAMRTPSFMPTYERLHCNRRRKAEVRAISMEQWDAGAEPAMGMEELREYLSGRDCYGGLDLSSTEDFSAWAMVFPDTFQVEGVEMEGVWVLPRLWIPRAAVDRHKSIRSSIDWWASQGWVTVTDGSVIDYDQLEAEIGEDATRHNVVEFAYDPWQAEALRQRLTSGGLIGWKCGQTMERMAPATHELDRLLGLTLIRHGGNPALAWMASNVVAKRDSAGRWKPEKQLSAEKIDGIVAVIMGVGAWRRPDRVAKPTKVATASGDVGDMPLTSGDDFFRSSGRLDI